MKILDINTITGIYLYGSSNDLFMQIIKIEGS